MSYDGSNRLTNEKFGPLNTTYAYSAGNGSLVSIDRGLGTLTTITAAAVQGLGAGTAINASQAVASVEDPLGNITSYTLDSLGRLTQLQTADGNGAELDARRGGKSNSLCRSAGPGFHDDLQRGRRT